MNWTYKPFAGLTPHELYAILQLRNAVFVVEQQCIFQDADNKDPYCYHVMGWEQTNLVAYTRIVPAGISYEESSIGRVVVLPTARKNGTGKILMQKSVEILFSLFGKNPVRIGAQLYLQQFYESLGIQQSGPKYFEDGIEHIEMILLP
jgi:ElaA protein